MDKLKTIAFIIGAMVVCYLFMIVAMPFLSDTANDSAAKIEAEHDLENYVGATEGLQAMPWVLYFVPGVGGVIAIVITLKRKQE